MLALQSSPKKMGRPPKARLPVACQECGDEVLFTVRGLCKSCDRQERLYGKRQCFFCRKDLIKNWTNSRYGYTKLVTCQGCWEAGKVEVYLAEFWSYPYLACAWCETTDDPHYAHGLCKSCWKLQRQYGEKPRCQACGQPALPNIARYPRIRCLACCTDQISVLASEHQKGSPTRLIARKIGMHHTVVEKICRFLTTGNTMVLRLQEKKRLIPILQTYQLPSTQRQRVPIGRRWQKLYYLGLVGDRTAWRQIIQDSQGMIRGLIQSLFLPGGNHEDLMQEGHIGLWKGLRNWKPEGGLPLVPFLKMAARRQIQTAIKLAGRQKHQFLNQARSLFAPTTAGQERQLLETVVGDHSPEAYVLDDLPLADGDDLAVIRRLDPQFLAQLSLLERQAMLGFLMGDTYQEIAQDLGRERKAVDNALLRARNRARALGPAAVILDYSQL